MKSLNGAQMLGAKTQRDTDDAGARDQGNQVDPLGEDHHRGDHEDRDGGATAQHGGRGPARVDVVGARPPTADVLHGRRHPLTQRPEKARLAVVAGPVGEPANHAIDQMANQQRGPQNDTIVVA